jgi:hypothetical protein
MAKTIEFLEEIQTNSPIKSKHISQLVEAFSGAEVYNINISGSLDVSHKIECQDIEVGNVLSSIIELIPIDPTRINPSGKPGLIIFDSNTNQPLYSDGTDWQSFK